MTTAANKALEKPIDDWEYQMKQMPNGKFVGEVYNLTHKIAKDIGHTNHSNEQFMAAEKTIRDYVWMACKRARQSLQSAQETRADLVKVVSILNAIKSRPECMAAWPLVDNVIATLNRHIGDE